VTSERRLASAAAPLVTALLVSGATGTLAVLHDKKIDWSVGSHWLGVTGKVNPSSGRLSVSSGKESAHDTYRALVNEGDQGFKTSAR